MSNSEDSFFSEFVSTKDIKVEKEDISSEAEDLNSIDENFEFSSTNDINVDKEDISSVKEDENSIVKDVGKLNNDRWNEEMNSKIKNSVKYLNDKINRVNPDKDIANTHFCLNWLINDKELSSKKCEDKSEKIENLENRLKKANKDNEDIKTEIENLENRLKKANKDNEDIKTELTTSKNLNIKMKASNVKLKEKYKKAYNDNKELINDKELRISQEKLSKSTEINKLTTIDETLTPEFQQERISKDTEIKRLTTTNISLINEIENLKNRYEKQLKEMEDRNNCEHKSSNFCFNSSTAISKKDSEIETLNRDKIVLLNKIQCLENERNLNNRRENYIAPSITGDNPVIKFNSNDQFPDGNLKRQLSIANLENINLGKTVEGLQSENENLRNENKKLQDKLDRERCVQESGQE